jgi:glycosyltransferase involved in cell wall biosynthesis
VNHAQLKIALVGDYPPPFGGVSVHVAALAQALRSRHVDVRVLDIGRGDHRGPAIAPARGAPRYAAMLAAVAAEQRLVHVHTSGANLKSWLVALAASRVRLPGAPRPLLTIHSGLAPRYLGSRRCRQRMAQAICSGFGHVLAVSPDLAAALEGAGVPRALVSVEPAFLVAQLAPGLPPPAVGDFRAAHAPLFCACVAPGATYGEDLLARAFEAVRRRLPRAGLVVFGRGSECGAAMARGPAAGHGGGVLALGEVEHAAALGVLCACDVFVRPTRADGDALSVREALALGRAVVASDVGYRPPGCLLFRADDAADLVDRMVEVSLLPARAGRPAAARDALGRILALYRALTRGRPIPTDSACGGQLPSWSR